MTKESVCAVMVTYHPSPKMLENLTNVLAQVQGLVVVDNGSNMDELQEVRKASRTLGFHLIENGKNLGIAEALNQGVRWTKSAGYPWVILFDQDSRVTEGFVRQMLADWKSHPDRERVGSLHPRYVDPDTGIEAAVPRDMDGSLVLPMTSGTLMPLWIFEKVGWFASEYFIDLVDWEYCFRIKAAGLFVADSRDARLLHAAGSPARTRVLGRIFQPSHHSATRRYYISRNSIAFYRKYFLTFPAQVLYCIGRQFRELLVCLIAERDRRRKFHNFLLGTWDGLVGRMGERKGL